MEMHTLIAMVRWDLELESKRDAFILGAITMEQWLAFVKLYSAVQDFMKCKKNPGEAK